jgi:hypothetical protein
MLKSDTPVRKHCFQLYASLNYITVLLGLIQSDVKNVVESGKNVYLHATRHLDADLIPPNA